MPFNPQPASVETLIDRLIADPERLETTHYAEMGVAMFLIGEDRVSETSRAPAAGGTDSLGFHFAELATELARRKPAIDEDDVANLLEILAEQYFVPRTAEPHATDASAAPPELVLSGAATPLLAELTAGLARSQAIRVINYHATPRYREAEFRRQIEQAAQIFEPITRANFAAAVAGRWAHARPGLMPALFEGYRDNLDVMLPILEEFGFTGWFFVPSGFLNIPAHDQRSYARDHHLHLPDQDEYPDERYALTWDEARDIARRGHVFACHTRTHHSLMLDTQRGVLENEIVAAKAEMDAELGVEPGGRVDIFCWLEGAALGVHAEADEMLRQAGFRYLLSNFKIQTL